MADPTGERGCHGGRETMQEAARAAGKSAVLDQLTARLSARPARPAAIDVPGLRLAARRAAHAADRDHPVRLRLLRLRPDLHLAFLRRASAPSATCRSTPKRWCAASCSRTSATPCTTIAKPEDYDCRRRHQSLRADRVRRAARSAAQADQRRARHRHRRAGLRRADPCRGEGCAGRCDAALCAAGSRARSGAAPAPGDARAAQRRADRRAVPGRSGRRRRRCSRRWGLPSRRRCRRANGATCTARSTASSPRRCIRSTPHRCASSSPPAGPIVGSGPVGFDGTAAWLERDRRGQRTHPQLQSTRRRRRRCRRSRAALEANPIDARITVSGYEGSELLVARLLIEAGAEVPYVGTACPRTEWSEPDRAWLAGAGARTCSTAPRWSRTWRRCRKCGPILRSAPRRWCSRRRKAASRRLYFTNMVSARPLFGPAGAGALAGIVAAQTRGRERFARMVSFFDKVGAGDAAGYGWKGVPKAPPGAARSGAEGEAGARSRRSGGGDLGDAGARSRSRRRLLGRGLRLHRGARPAGRHRRPGGLREPARHRGAALHRRAAAARTSRRRHGIVGGATSPDRHRGRDAPRQWRRRTRTCRPSSSPAASPR